MKVTEILTELGNKPYPFKLDPDSDKTSKWVTSKDGKISLFMQGKEVYGQQHGWIIDISFRVNGEIKQTGGGDQFRIFATVAQMIQKRLPPMINQLDPMAVFFHASNEEQSRVGLYDRRAVDFFNKLLGPGWEFNRTVGPKDTLYQWTRFGYHIG